MCRTSQSWIFQRRLRGEWIVYQNDMNEYGCPLLGQSGSVAVINFDALIGQLPEELRRAFEAERATLQSELAAYLSLQASDAPTPLSTTALREHLAQLAAPLAWIEQFLHTIAQCDLRMLLDGLIPRSATHGRYGQRRGLN